MPAARGVHPNIESENVVSGVSVGTTEANRGAVPLRVAVTGGSLPPTIHTYR